MNARVILKGKTLGPKKSLVLFLLLSPVCLRSQCLRKEQFHAYSYLHIQLQLSLVLELLLTFIFSHEGECHRETEEEGKEASMSGIIAVSGASSFSDVILCKHCLLKDARSAEQLRLLFAFSP